SDVCSSDLLGLSVAAIVCLPRQFQVTVVENSDESHLRVASWAFPAYMMVMSLFILPIAVFGLTRMPAGANPDMFALTLPLSFGQDGLALFAFIGGFSSRSEEHTSELQSRENLVCRLLLEKK